jgi:hypothetical protein
LDIRTRLLLLVFAVWLPAAAGFGLLARTTYEREADSAMLRLQQVACPPPASSSAAVVVATGYTTQQADGDVQMLRKPYGLEAVLSALQAAAESRTNAAQLD